MSESATFSQPSSATVGLQGYDLEKPAKNLYPGPDVSGARRRRFAAWRKKLGKSAAAETSPMTDANRPQKDSVMFQDTIEAMVGTLSKSVSEIHAANPDDRDALLAKSFGEFKDALAKSAGEAIQAAGVEALEKVGFTEADLEPLAKGLGTISRVAGVVSYLSGQMQRIKDGKDWSDDKNVDPASDEVVELMEHSLACAELALRASVNEHVTLDDAADGMTVHIPLISGGVQVAKCDLPEDLAKMASDPAAIAEEVVQIGAALMLAAGIEQGALEKVFAADDELQKGDKPFPPKKEKKPGEPDGDEPPAGAGAQAASSSAPAPDAAPADPTDPGAAGDPGDFAGDDPIDIACRLAAALMIQLDHIQQMVQGGGEDPTAADAAGAPGDAPPAPAIAKAAPEAPAGTAPLAKAETALDASDPRVRALIDAELAPFRPMLEQLQKAADTPEPPKGVMLAPALSKVEDTGGAKVDDPYAPEKLEKMSPERRAEALIRKSLAKPMGLIG